MIHVRHQHRLGVFPPRTRAVRHVGQTRVILIIRSTAVSRRGTRKDAQKKEPPP